MADTSIEWDDEYQRYEAHCRNCGWETTGWESVVEEAAGQHTCEPVVTGGPPCPECGVPASPDGVADVHTSDCPKMSSPNRAPGWQWWCSDCTALGFEPTEQDAALAQHLHRERKHNG